MKNKQQAAPQYTTDADGQQLVHIALANTDQRATLYAADLHRWLEAGFSSYWSFVSTGGQNQYVLANARSPSNSQRSLTVARWIAEAGKGQRVNYTDGDRLNLRRDNLRLVRGPAKASTSWVRPNDGTPPRRKPKPETQESAAAMLWPAETLKLVAAAVDSHRKTSSHVSFVNPPPVAVTGEIQSNHVLWRRELLRLPESAGARDAVRPQAPVPDH